MNKDRDSNIELLRIVLMWMIVFWHLIVHGIGLAHPETIAPSKIDYWPKFIGSLLCYHVNCFIFISGYYGIHFQLEKFVSLFLKLLFYSFFTLFLARYFFLGSDFLSGFPLWEIFPFGDGGWWFMKDYLALFFFAPLFNRAIGTINKREFTILLLGLLLFSVSGFKYILIDNSDRHFLFFVMYLLGGYFRKYDDTFIEKNSYSMFFISIFGLLCYQTFNILFDKASSFLYVTSYSNPFTILAAISFFFIFKKWKIAQNKMINWLASGSLAAYLITDGCMSSLFNSWVIQTFGDNILLLFFISSIIVLICSLFEIFRKRITIVFEDYFIKMVRLLR